MAPTTKPPPPVKAYDRYRDNAALIQAARRLGHISDASHTIDLTYGKGTWWKRWRPDRLITNDLDISTDAEHHLDFTAPTLFFARFGRAFDVVCYDPPYGLRGTVNSTNGGYGLGQYMSIDTRHQMMRIGVQTAINTVRPGGTVLAKCQDQVASGRLWFQTNMLTEAAGRVGGTLIERLDMMGGRAQPARHRWACLACGKDNCGPRHACRTSKSAAWKDWAEKTGGTIVGPRPSPQNHAYYRPSTLLIFRKDR